MTTLALQKKANELEKVIQKASRVLLEFEVMQAKWEKAHGKYKVYPSASAYMQQVRRKLKSQ